MIKPQVVENRQSYSESEGTEGGPNMRFTYNGDDVILDKRCEREKYRNFKPMCMNKNVSPIG